MMRIVLPCVLGFLALVLLLPSSAQGPSETTLSQPFAEIGEQVLLKVQLITGTDVTVEVDATASSWGDVRVIRVLDRSTEPRGGGVIHSLEILVSPFAPGTLTFSPALLMMTPRGIVPAYGSRLVLTVLSTLRADDPLQLSPLPKLSAVDGGQSPLLWPAMAVAGVSLAIVVLGAVVIAARWLRNCARRLADTDPGLDSAPDDILAPAASALDQDAVAAYRAIGSVVRRVLGDRYAFPARALTTDELDRRMDLAGVDSWEARLARELLRECDAVVYGGYRPALERRYADLTVAREIVGGGF